MANKKAHGKKVTDRSKTTHAESVKGVGESLKNINLNSDKENHKCQIDAVEKTANQSVAGDIAAKSVKPRENGIEKPLQLTNSEATSETTNENVKEKASENGKKPPRKIKEKAATVQKKVATDSGADKAAKNSLEFSCNHFTIDFLKNSLRGNNEKKANILFSPFGVLTNISMLLYGAFSETKAEILKTLKLDNFTGDTEIYKEFKNLIYNEVRSTAQFTLKVRSIAFFNKQISPDVKFKNHIYNYFQTPLNSHLDFKDGEGKIVKEGVNRWAPILIGKSGSELIDQPPAKDTLLHLITAAYFNGAWVKPFECAQTSETVFRNSDGSQSKVKMMKGTHREHCYANLAETHKLKVLELCYPSQVSMYIFLPIDTHSVANLISELTPQLFKEVLGKLKPCVLKAVAIPKFKLEKRNDLKSSLSGMGLKRLFSPEAQLSKITNSLIKMKVSNSTHLAVMEVHEGGTQAGDVVDSQPKASDSESVNEEFIADHPFLFLIRDKNSGINMFAGIINKL